MEGRFPLFFDLLLVGGAAFVVKDLKVDVVTIFLEMGHYAVGSGDAVAVVLGLEGLNEDDVGVGVVGGHDVTIAAA